MIVGGYDLHLYCDTGNKEPSTVNSATIPDPHDYGGGGTGEFFGHNERDARAEAKRAGWTFKSGGFVYCPKCSRRQK